MNNKLDGPIAICGLPRSGTSALYEIMSQSPELKGPIQDKELRYFEHFLQDRPWGIHPSYSDPALKRFDGLVVSDTISAIDRILRKTFGGPDGRYLIANPRDVFYIEILRSIIPDMQFIVILRHPIANVWSMLNYPQGTWAPNSDPSLLKFPVNDIEHCIAHWLKTTESVLTALTSDFTGRCLVITHEDVILEPKVALSRLFDFASLTYSDSTLDAFADGLIHSSFVTDMTDRDYGEEAKREHFRHNFERAMADPHLPSLVEKYCSYRLDQLQRLGVTFRSL